MILRVSKHLLAIVAYGLFGMALGVVGVYLFHIKQWPELQSWHLAPLEAEFSASRSDEIKGLQDYRRLEDRLFVQLRDQAYVQSPSYERGRLERFNAGSLVDPLAQSMNWNRSFEMPVQDPMGGALLIHGLSDSPYSMRALAELLREQGYWVVALRLPGHGTAPSGLVNATWKDFSAAVRMAAVYLSKRIGQDRPLLLAGYSNGAALAVEYSLAVLEGEPLPAADGLVLISPAIGVSPVAVLARWQGRLAKWLGMDKLNWLSVLPEFDPYKYNSFAINASEQIYALTQSIAERLKKLQGEPGLAAFPRVLAFQSVADATIPPTAVVDRLLLNLTPKGHELVLFDINRHAEAEPLLNSDAAGFVNRLMEDRQLPFDLTLVTNRTTDTNQMVARRKAAETARAEEELLGMAWPQGVYSLSHLALPFRPDDPVYGEFSNANDRVISLGNLELRGEDGVLVVPSSYFLRLRYNPFFPYLEDRVLEMITQINEGYSGL